MSARSGWRLAARVLGSAVVTVAALALVSGSGGADTSPDRRQSPSEVVRIQVEALASVGLEDGGIATAFRFASPGNRESTGPLERFASMLRGPSYSPMLGHVLAEYGEPEVSGDRAMQVVTLWTPDGRRARYLFSLSRQSDAPYEGCWMTDAVYLLELDGDPGDGRLAA